MGQALAWVSSKLSQRVPIAKPILVALALRPSKARVMLFITKTTKIMP
jgi:hypothetical protein